MSGENEQRSKVVSINMPLLNLWYFMGTCSFTFKTRLSSIKQTNVAYSYPWGACCKELLSQQKALSQPCQPCLLIFLHFPLETCFVSCIGCRRPLLTDSRHWNNTANSVWIWTRDLFPLSIIIVFFFICFWRSSSSFFHDFLLCCPSQRSAQSQVPSQVATHQKIGS
jgi:hypothetical protein